jgi:hypothetical protein
VGERHVEALTVKILLGRAALGVEDVADDDGSALGRQAQRVGGTLAPGAPG